MSTNVRKNLSLAVAFVSGVLAVGVPYWSMAYGKVKLPVALVGPGLLVPVGAALLLCASRVASLHKVLLVMGATVPAAVCLRVARDVAADPTSHNLWPFEVVIASFVGFPCALAGAIVGSMIAWLITHCAGKNAG